MRHWQALGCAAAVLIAAKCIAHAQPASDRIRNVEKAAEAIAAIQKETGTDGAFAAIFECYERELPRATSLTPEVEACAAQDIIVSKVTAAFFLKLSRKMAGAEEPQAVPEAMPKRVVRVFARFKIQKSDVRSFRQIVETYGMEAYGRARFPGQFPPKKD